MKNIKKWILAALVIVFGGVGAWADDHEAQFYDEVFIVSGEMVKVMIQIPAASGEKYEALGDSDTIFWSKGDEAFLTIEGEECSKYVLVRPFADKMPDELFLTVDGKNYIMKNVISASGAKYEAVDDPKTVLWNKEESVTLEVEGTIYPNYDLWQPLGRIWLPSPDIGKGMRKD